jgi:hypothetical protein
MWKSQIGIDVIFPPFKILKINQYNCDCESESDSNYNCNCNCNNCTCNGVELVYFYWISKALGFQGSVQGTCLTSCYVTSIGNLCNVSVAPSILWELKKCHVSLVDRTLPLNGTARFKKCTQYFEYQHLLLLIDIWRSKL